MSILDAIRRANCSFTYRKYRGWSYRWALGDWCRRLVFELQHNVWGK